MYDKKKNNRQYAKKEIVEGLAEYNDRFDEYYDDYFNKYYDDDPYWDLDDFDDMDYYDDDLDW